MSIFDNARKKALEKLEEEEEEKSEEKLSEDEAAEDGVESEETPSTIDAGGGGATDAEDADMIAEDEGAVVDDSVDDVVDGEVPTEGEVIEEEPPQSPEGDSSPEGGAAGAEDELFTDEGAADKADDGVPAGNGAEDEEAPSTTDAGVGGPPPTEGGGAEIADDDLSAEGESVADEEPLSEREQRLASEINRLQDVADQATAQLSELQAQLDEANKLLEQTSATAEEAIEGAAVQSGPPIFDHAAYRMMDAAAAEEYAAEHDRRMSEYYGRQAEERYQPYIDEHDKAMRAEGRRSAIGRLFETGELPGIEESETDIFRILDEIPALQNDDSESAVAAAYLISVGLNAIKSKGEGKDKTAAEIVAEIEANPEVMKLLAEKQAAALEENGKIPAFTRRASARSVPTSAPSTLNDASARARKRFGLK